MAIITIATCAAYIAALAGSNGGDTLQLAVGTNCDNIQIKKDYTPEISINAAGSTTRGMKITGSGVALLGGTYSSLKGEDGGGPDYYALNLSSAKRVRVTDATIVSGTKLAVVSNATSITFKNNVFRLGGDGIIAQGATDLVIDGNTFSTVSFVPTQCIDTIGGAPTVLGLSRSKCLDLGANWIWIDGWHQDAVQLVRIVNGTVINNTIVETQQGIVDFGGANDPENINLVVEQNNVRVIGYHSISLTNTTDAKIRFNTIHPATNGNKTPIRWLATPGAIVCGNTVARVNDPGGQAC